MGATYRSVTCTRSPHFFFPLFCSGAVRYNLRIVTNRIQYIPYDSWSVFHTSIRATSYWEVPGFCPASLQLFLLVDMTFCNSSNIIMVGFLLPPITDPHPFPQTPLPPRNSYPCFSFNQRIKDCQDNDPTSHLFNFYRISTNDADFNPKPKTILCFIRGNSYLEKILKQGQYATRSRHTYTRKEPPSSMSKKRLFIYKKK